MDVAVQDPPAPKAPAGTPPPPQTQEEANDRWDAKLFTAGVDKVDSVLDPASRSDLQGMLAGVDDPKEATAQMVNLSYAARHTKMDPEALSANWPAVRDQFASAVSEKPQQNVSDSQLYTLIGQSITKRQGEQAMMGKVQMEMLHDAAQGATSYVPTLQRMHEAMRADPNYDPAHEDQYLFAAKGAWAQIQPMAAKIAPAAQLAASVFKDMAANPEAFHLNQYEPAIQALQALEPRERQMAIAAATEMAGRQISSAEQRGVVEEPGTEQALQRGTMTTFQQAGHTAMRLLRPVLGQMAGGPMGLPDLNRSPSGDEGADTHDQIARDLWQANQEAYAPNGSRPERAWYSFANNLPALAGMILQPATGTSLVLGSMADQSMGDLQKRGLSDSEAFAGGMVAAAPAAAIMKLQSTILAGDSMPWLGKLVDNATENLIGRMAGKTLGAFSANAVVLNFGQAAQDAFDPGIQAITSKLDSAVPGVNWKQEFKQLGATRLDTFLNLLPLAMVGTGSAALRESSQMRAFVAQKDFMKAAGFSKEQLEAISNAPDGDTASRLIREAWFSPKGTPEEKAAGMVQADKAADDAAARIVQPDGAGVPVGDDPHQALSQADTSAQIIADSNDHAAQGGDAEMFHVEQSGDEPAEVSPEKQLSQDLNAVEPGKAPGIAEKVAQSIADAKKTGVADQLPKGITDWLGDVRKAAGAALKELTSAPEMGPFKQALNGLIGRMQRNTMDVRKLVDTIDQLVPDPVRREGITNWIQAAGDESVLNDRLAATSKAALKRGYEAALNLTEPEKALAQRVMDFYKRKFDQLSAAGLVETAKQNYVNQVWKREFVGGGDAAQFASKLDRNFKFGKESSFGNYFAGEQAGFEPVTKDISRLVGMYLSESNKVMATREFIKSLTSLDAPDSTPEAPRPYASPLGGGSISQEAEEGPSFIRPNQRGGSMGDYKKVDHPAMRDWKWIGKDAGGNDVMLEGELGIHPDAARFVNALIGRDRLRDWYDAPGGKVQAVVKAGLKAVDTASSAAKGLMFSLSGYHQVQETIRAVGYRVNPFSNLPELDAKSPLIRRSTDAGLMLAADHGGMRDYMEGYGSNNVFSKVPVAGKLATDYSHWFFSDYLPRLKQKTWEAVVERNTDRYSDALESGKMKQADIDYLSASQVNAAYGHLNYADLGRSPTARHIARLAFLAPDFLESTGRTVAQAGKSVLGNKAGAEQIQALAFLGLTQWMTCRVLNKTVDGDWHNDEPFGVVVGGRTYSVRTIPGDIFQAVDQPRGYASGRISPVISAAWEAGSGKNYRGEKVGVTDAIRDIATNVLPMSLRPFLGRAGAGSSNVPTWDQFITSNGLRISRNSDINSAFHLGQQFARDNAPKDQKPDSTVYPVSEWQQMRYALEDGDQTKAQAELRLVQQERPKLASGGKALAAFKESLFRPFAGSTKLERQFEASLEGHDAEVFQKAVAARAKVWSDFLKLDLGAQPPASETKDSQ